MASYVKSTGMNPIKESSLSEVYNPLPQGFSKNIISLENKVRLNELKEEYINDLLGLYSVRKHTLIP